MIQGKKGRDPRQAGLTALVGFTILEILGVGWLLLRSHAPHWMLSELALSVFACIALHELARYVESTLELCRPPRRRPAGRPDRTTEGHPRAVPPRDIPPRAEPQRPEADNFACPTTEQLAQAMLTQAFRQFSMKLHPDRGGSVEAMRRLYAARELLRRAIPKPTSGAS